MASEEEEPKEGPLLQSPDGGEETTGAECTASVCERPGTTALTLGRGEESRRLATSTINEWWSRKSIPGREKLTMARRKVHWPGTPPMVTVRRSPHQGIRRPSILDNPGPDGGEEDCQGMMEKAEPVSTR